MGRKELGAEWSATQKLWEDLETVQPFVGPGRSLLEKDQAKAAGLVANPVGPGEHVQVFDEQGVGGTLG